MYVCLIVQLAAQASSPAGGLRVLIAAKGQALNTFRDSVSIRLANTLPRFKGWRNRLHLLVERAAMSHCQGADAQRGRICGEFYNLPQYVKEEITFFH